MFTKTPARLATVRVRWLNLNPGAPRDEAGYWRSVEGRFSISPNYRHTVNPDSYTLYDAMERDDAARRRGYNFPTVSACKEFATRIIMEPTL